MAATYFMRIYASLIALLTIGGLVYVVAFPAPGMRVNRDGVPHFTPMVINPETGKEVPVDELARHFKGQ